MRVKALCDAEAQRGLRSERPWHRPLTSRKVSAKAAMGRV